MVQQGDVIAACVPSYMMNNEHVNIVATATGPLQAQSYFTGIGTPSINCGQALPTSFPQSSFVAV